MEWTLPSKPAAWLRNKENIYGRGKKSKRFFHRKSGEKLYEKPGFRHIVQDRQDT